MKKYSAILFAMILALSCIALTACGGGGDSSTEDLSDSPYVGTWVIDTLSMGDESDAADFDAILVINGDGTGTMGDNEETSEFTWEPVDGGFKCKGDVKADFEEEGDGLKTSMLGVELHFIRQEDAAAAAEESGIDLSANITKTDDSETGNGVVESDVFKLTLPNGASWDYEVVSPTEIRFYNKAAKEAELGGGFFSLEVLDKDDQTLDIVPGAVVGEMDGKNITAVFVSDVQYDAQDEAASKEYMEVFDVVQTISDDAATSPLVLK